MIFLCRRHRLTYTLRKATVCPKRAFAGYGTVNCHGGILDAFASKFVFYFFCHL